MLNSHLNADKKEIKMDINREILLKQVEFVQPGLSIREIIEQSSCIVFKNKRMTTYNDEISCSIKTDLDITGAVQSAPLLSILKSLPDENLKIEIKKDPHELQIKAKRKKAGIRMDSEILMPIEHLEKPKKWKILPDDFSDAINLVIETAGSDEAQFILTCIRITPKWIESCNNVEASRYKMKMDIKEPLLIRRSAMSQLKDSGMIEYSETKSWIHFRNSEGLVFSCRIFIETYPKLTNFFKVEGEEISLPTGINDMIERASIFSSDSADSNSVQVDLTKDKVTVTGLGVSGWYKEHGKVKYKKRALSFSISPKTLKTIIDKNSPCIISKDRLKTVIGKFKYITVLGKVEEDE